MLSLTSKAIDVARFFPASILALTVALAVPVDAASAERADFDERPTSADATSPRAQPSALAGSIDQNRAIVVDRIVRDWGNALSASSAGITSDQLREILIGLRADHLLAAALAGTLEGLRDVLAYALASTAIVPVARDPKALGDASDDLVYTPLPPCRLVDTRGYGAPIQGGAFVPNERRTITPAGACSIPTSNVAALVLSFHTQNLTYYYDSHLQAYLGGYISMVAPGAPASVVTSVFNPGTEWAAGSAIVRTDSSSGFDVYVAQTNSHVMIDVVGYFAPPKT